MIKRLFNVIGVILCICLLPFWMFLSIFVECLAVLASIFQYIITGSDISDDTDKSAWAYKIRKCSCFSIMK